MQFKGVINVTFFFEPSKYLVPSMKIIHLANKNHGIYSNHLPLMDMLLGGLIPEHSLTP
jgi:hypothetical protein